MTIKDSYPNLRPTLLLDFTNSETLDPRLTFSRAGSATRVNQLGIRESVAANVPRFNYDPVTLACRGLLIEEQRTNSLKNNTMAGAVVGNPGTIPTFWALGLSSGMSREVVGLGTENGIQYIDVRIYGTSNLSATLAFQGSTVVPAAMAQTWTASAYIKLVAGSLTNVSSIGLTVSGRDSSGLQVEATNVTVAYSTITSGLGQVRTSSTRAMTNTLTSFVNASTGIVTVGTFDITLRIGFPQLELGATATSPILTSSAAVTRTADVVTLSTINAWYRQSEGTFVTEHSQSAQGLGCVFSMSDGSLEDYIALKNSPTGATVNVLNSTVASVNFTFNGAANTIYKTAIAYKVNDFRLVYTGSNILAASPATLPTVTQLSLGNLAGLEQLNGNIRRLAYYPVSLPSSNLISTTL